MKTKVLKEDKLKREALKKAFEFMQLEISNPYLSEGLIEYQYRHPYEDKGKVVYKTLIILIRHLRKRIKEEIKRK